MCTHYRSISVPVHGQEPTFLTTCASTHHDVGDVCMPSGVTLPPLEQIRNLNYSDPTQSSDKFILEDSGYVARRYAVPTIFRQMLDSSTIPSSRQYYWWRSQVRRWYCVPTYCLNHRHRHVDPAVHGSYLPRCQSGLAYTRSQLHTYIHRCCCVLATCTMYAAQKATKVRMT